MLGFITRWLTIPYTPRPDGCEVIAEALTQSREGLDVSVAVLDGAASRKFFGVPMARRGIQPVWLRVVNRTTRPYRLQFVAIDPNHFSPWEAAALNHYSGGKRLLGFGLIGWLFFFPLLLLLPIKLLAVRRVNRRMDQFFQEHAFRSRPILPGSEQSGFVFTNLTEGNKIVTVRLLSPAGQEDFQFSVPVDGLKADYLRRDLEDAHSGEDVVDVDIAGLREYLAAAPATTTNRSGQRTGDPVNLVVVGDFHTILGAFGARWDETEVITFATCRKTARAFLTGAEYRYSPVSALYLFGRSQDFALQRIRSSINERLHLRLWAVPLRFRGQGVWIGQISRDIGVRFTWRTWNLTTHRIDPDVDEARDYVVEDIIHVGRLEMAGYVDGVGECELATPRRNLTGDPYFTDGKRAVVFLSETTTTARYIEFS